MPKRLPYVLLLAATTILRAADPSLFIAPVSQSSFVTYQASTLQQVIGFPAGGNAKAMVLSEDGKSAYVTAMAEGDVLQIDLGTGSVLQTYLAGPDPIALGLSPDGADLYVLTGGYNSYLFAFDTGTGAQAGKAAAGYKSVALAVSPDGKKIYVANPSRVLDFDSSTLTITSTVPLSLATTLAFGPSSQVLYAATILAGAQIQVINTTNDSVKATVSAGPVDVYGLAVSRDGTSLYAASDQGLLRMATSTNQITEVFNKALSFFAVALSPDGSTAICTGGPSVSINLATATSQRVALNGQASAAVYSPDGSQFYILLNTAFDVDYANLSTNQVSGAVSGVAGNYLLEASLSGNKIGAIDTSRGTFSLIDAASHTVDQTYTFPGSQGLAGLALNSTGTVALFPSGHPSPVLEILNLETGESTNLSIPDISGDIYAVVSPDDKTAYVLGNQLCAIDIAATTVIQCGPTIELGYTGLLKTLALNSAGTRVFAIAASSVSEYDASSLSTLQTASLPSGQTATGVTYSAATNSIYVIATDATNATGAVSRVDAKSFTVVATAATATGLSDIAISPDGKQVYLAGYTNQIQILDGTTLAAIGDVAQIRASSLVTTTQ